MTYESNTKNKFEVGELVRLAYAQGLYCSTKATDSINIKWYDFAENTVCEIINVGVYNCYTIWFPKEQLFADGCLWNRFKTIDL